MVDAVRKELDLIQSPCYACKAYMVNTMFPFFLQLFLLHLGYPFSFFILSYSFSFFILPYPFSFFILPYFFSFFILPFPFSFFILPFSFFILLFLSSSYLSNTWLKNSSTFTFNSFAWYPSYLRASRISFLSLTLFRAGGIVNYPP